MIVNHTMDRQRPTMTTTSSWKAETPGEMGLRDIRLIEAMYRSADNGGTVVKL